MNASADTLVDHVIVCGLGHVGYRCLCLLSRLGERGAAIAREVRQQWRLDAFSDFALLLGDARDEKLLREAGIARAKAIIIVTDDDLANVSIALDARRLNPRIAIVVRLFDPSLAAHLEQSGQVQRAFSAAALAAPAFLAAALGSDARGSFHFDGRVCTIREQEIAAAPGFAAPETLHAWSTQSGRAVMALERRGQLILRPPGDTRLAAGDRLTTLELSDAQQEKRKSAWRLPASLRALAVGVRHWWRDVPRPVRRGLGALIGLVALSVLVFRCALGISLVDAFYFVITTVTTVGYGDYSLRAEPAWLKLYSTILMISGAVLLAALVSIITDLVLSMRLGDLLAHGRAQLQEHVIVAGLGDMGFHLVRDLAHSGESVVAVEWRPDNRFVDAAREWALVVLGNAKTEETLRKAGAAHAKAVVAVADDDLVNLTIGLAAARAGARCRTVVRMFDSQLAEKIQGGLPIDAVLSVSGAAAPVFVGATFCPDVLQGFLLHDWLVLLFVRQIDVQSPLVGRPAGALAGNEAALLVRQAGESRYREAPADYALAAGDQVIGARWQHCPGSATRPT